MPFIACKLPHGLKIRFSQTETLVLKGSNIGERLDRVSENGRPEDNRSRVSGFGITEVDAKQAEAFEGWRNRVMYVDGQPTKGKLANPFLALDNGSILGPFKTFDDASKECATLADAITTGFEGLDADAEAEKPDGVKPDKEAGKGS